MTAKLVPGQHAFENNRTIIAYYIRGKGPPCFIVPYAWGMNSEPMRVFFKPLEKKLTLIYHDPPGTGRSGPPPRDRDLGMNRVVDDLLALQNRLEIPRAIFLGHSGGSAVALAFALRHPDRVSSLIIVGSGGVIPDVLSSPAVRDAATESLGRRDEDSFRRLQAGILGPEIRTKSGKATMGRAMKHSFGFNIDRAAYNFMELREWDVRDSVGGLPVRTLILAGKLDRLTPPQLSRELKKGIKGSKLVVFKKSGHFPFLDEPREFFKAVTDFLDEKESAHRRP